MNIDKSQIKINVAHDIGVRLEDALEAARAVVARADGMAMAAVKIGTDIEALFPLVQKEIDDGTIELVQGKVILSWLTRAKNVANSQVAQSATAKAMAQGKVVAGEAAVRMVLAVKSDEEHKVRSITEAVTSGKVRMEDAGRPPPSIKAQRLAEEDDSAVEPEQPETAPEETEGPAPSSAPSWKARKKKKLK